MTHTYTIYGMTCTSCHTKVEGLLHKITGVEKLTIDLLKGPADIEISQQQLLKMHL